MGRLAICSNGQFFLYFYDDTPAVRIKKVIYFYDAATDDDADNVRGEFVNGHANSVVGLDSFFFHSKWELDINS